MDTDRFSILVSGSSRNYYNNRFRRCQKSISYLMVCSLFLTTLIWIQIKGPFEKPQMDVTFKQPQMNDTFDPLMPEPSLVIVVQVHNRPLYLKYLIESLSKANQIEEALLVFSHDVHNDEIDGYIKNITFCRVMQIFFPYSVERYPDKFPGNDPKDCPKDIGRKEADKIKCQNAEYPDQYGHYRESKFTQIKHHWWWKLNYVFNHLNYDGLMLFLEEDHYVATDFIYMLNLMDNECRTMENCQFLGLGRHERTLKVQANSDKVEMSSLNTNLGLAFNRTTYLEVILNCGKEFCEYDDYNWDWSLNYITNVCSKTPRLAMISACPRVFHIGECGIHVHKGDCNESTIVFSIETFLERIELYPTSLKVTNAHITKPKFRKNGGWGDIRDHALCLHMTK